MERELWRECEQTLTVNLSTDNPLPLRTLTTVRSLIVSPSTSDSTISSILETLTTILSLHRHNHFLCQRVISLLSALSQAQPHLSDIIFSSVLSLFSSFTTDSAFPILAAAALSLLLSLAELNQSLRPSVDYIDDNVLVSLCFRPYVRSRLWILRNAARFHIRPHLLVTVLLGFTKDPFPGVRIAALDRLLKVCSEVGIVLGDCGMIEGCFLQAVKLLRDAEEDVRAAAVRVVSAWGQMLVDLKSQEDKIDCSNVLFLQLCSMVRDMSVAVRVEVFKGIGSMRLISEDMLLMTLSKRVQKGICQIKTIALSSGELYSVHTSSAAGAFLHGLEDEFTEVRRASCNALHTVISISAQFASEAVTLLMDAMNDDSVMVRLQILKTMHLITMCNYFKMQQDHIDMLLGALGDNCPQVRDGVMKILGSLKLPNFKLFKLSIESLLQSLILYPQDEAKYLCTLFKVGQNHASYALHAVEDADEGMNLSSGNKVAFDSPNTVAQIVLVISASLSVEASSHHIPPKIFSYTAVFIGQIVRALRDVIDQDTLLAYLSCCSRSSLLSSFKDEYFSNDTHKNNGEENNFQSALMETDDFVSEIRAKCKSSMVTHQLKTSKDEPVAEVLESVNLVLATIKHVWHLGKSGETGQALKALRSCKEELNFFQSESNEAMGTLAFGLHYIRVIKQLLKLREHLSSQNKFLLRNENLELLFVKLNKHLLILKYQFKGISREDRLYILELALLGSVLRFLRIQEHSIAFKMLSHTISEVGTLCKAVSVGPSDFVSQLSRAFQEDCSVINESFYNRLSVRKVSDLFHPKDIILSKSVQHIRADIEFPEVDSLNPLPFIPGLSVGVPCEITLYNVSLEDRLWLKMKVDEGYSHLVFLDLDDIGGSNDIKKFLYTAPFNGTPKASAFTLKICIGIECLPDDDCLEKNLKGPGCQLTYICKEKEIELQAVHKV